MHALGWSFSNFKNIEYENNILLLFSFIRNVSMHIQLIILLGKVMYIIDGNFCNAFILNALFAYDFSWMCR